MAHLELHASGGGDAALFAALSAAGDAVRLDRSSPEACFNFALAAERLYLRKTARAAWKSCLELEGAPGWAELVRRHWFLLSRPLPREVWPQRKAELERAVLEHDEATVAGLVAACGQRFRLYAQEVALAEWGSHYASGHDAAAAQELDIARAIGEQLAAQGGDPMVREMVAAIDATPLRSVARAFLAVAHHWYGAGVEAYGRGEAELARQAFRRSASALATQSSPLTLWVRFDLVRCDYQRSRYGQLLASLSSLTHTPGGERYPALVARSEWATAIVLGVAGELEASQSAYLRALDWAERGRERETATAVRGFLAENFRLLGATSRALPYLLKALSGLRELHDPLRLQVILEEGTQLALSQGWPQAALQFQNEAIAELSETEHVVATAQAYHRRATIYDRLGELSQAARDLEAARLALERISDAGMRDALRGDYLVALARVLRRTEPARALELLDKSLAAYESTDYVQALPALLLERARAALTVGREMQAASDLERAVEIVEEIRAGTGEGELRAAYLDQMQEIFDEMIRLQARRGDVSAAVNYAERARARVLLELAGAAHTGSSASHLLRPLSLPAIQQALPTGVGLVLYSVQPDNLLAWGITATALRAVSVEVTQRELERQIVEFRRAIHARPSAVESAASTLYALLFQRLRKPLAGSRIIVFLPDKVLHAVPFTALRDPATGRYLIEDFATVVSPSGSLFVAASARQRSIAPMTRPNSLVLGDPAFDRRQWPAFEPLPQSGQEAHRLAMLLPWPRVLLGGRATPRAFLELAASSRYIHLVSHTVLNRELPLRSGFLLTPEGAHATGLLTAAEVYGTRLTATELVTLAACSTAEGELRRGEGVANLVRPFLAAGVPAVVATLWPVEDAAAAQIFESFYRQLLEPRAASDALRSAQLQSLRRARRSPGSLRHWAALELVGSPGGARGSSFRKAN